MNFAVDILVKTSFILTGAALLAALLRKASAATRHAVWVLAIASTLLLPLAAPLLVSSLYRLCFPPLAPIPAAHQNNRHHLLFLLTLGAFMTTAGLVLLDLFFL